MTDLNELATYLSHVSWHGRYFSCNCVYHDDSSPSMMVYENGFNCKACGAWGSLEKLQNKLIGRMPVRVDTVSKYPKSPPWQTWETKYGDWETLASHAYGRAKQASFLWNYVTNRGISQFTIDKEMIGWVDRWITLPVFDANGDFVDLIVRGTSDSQIRYGIRPRVDNDTHLYAHWKAILDADKVYVCFGIFDRLTLTQCGIPAATGISGKTVNAQLLKDLRKPIYIIPDFREEEDARQLAAQLGWRGHVLDVQYPDGCKDMNDILKKYGEKKVLEVLNVGR
jgi:hypothetical protein